MGSSPAPQLPPIQPDPLAVAAEQQASNADQQQTQTDLADQTNTLQRTFGAQANGSVNGISSVAMVPLGTVAGVR